MVRGLTDDIVEVIVLIIKPFRVTAITSVVACPRPPLKIIFEKKFRKVS